VRSAPVVLYVRGNILPKDQRALAIIGTRKATPSSKDTARQFARDLAGHNVSIISGLALGIDASAHQGALDGGGRTIAVLGCGIDVIYPRQNKALADAIVQNGALISEFPLGEPPVRQNFPRRNRILSGMALGVLVVEAPEASGTMHTVTAALDQGRDVFAIPHGLNNHQGRGGNRLIQDGAKLILDPQDILNELDLTAEMVSQRTQAQRITADSEVEAKVLEHLSDAPIHVDDLARKTGLNIAELSATLTLLELKGLAQPVGLMQYCATYR
jgi:DNA processing protein